MALVWSDFEQGNDGNGIAVGIDVFVSGNTVSYGYYYSTEFPYNDDETLERSGAVTGNIGFHNSGGSSVGITGSGGSFVGTAGATYTFYASISGVYNGANPSVSNSVVVPGAPGGGVPGAPGVTADQITATSARLWCNVAAADNGSPITSINYRLIRESDGHHMGDQQDGYNPGVVFTGLTPFTIYQGYAQASNANGWGPFSAMVRFQTLQAAPGAPPQPTASAITASSATASWGAAATNGAPITSYQLQVSTSSTFGTLVHDTTANNLSRAVTGLSRVTPYYMRVRATNAIGTGPWSATGTFSTLPTVPSAPTITSISSITPTSAVVSWSPPTDNGGATVTAYDVQYSKDPAFATGVTTQATGNLTGLTPGATYFTRVRAKNASGAGPWSSVVSFTTATGIKVYTGSAWVDAPVYAYTGSAWVACEVRIWNGSAWVPTG